MDNNERTPTLYMMHGRPASGKTIMAKKIVAEDPNIKRVNRDGVRLMIQDGIYHPQLEVFVRVAEDAIVLIPTPWP